VTDTGGGFDPEEAKQVSKNRRDRGESRRGWGLKIMEELMDDVNIESAEKGTVITMVKKR
jgi:anti-sigma regulatory factor (Ser/Thr protein kinase)